MNRSIKIVATLFAILLVVAVAYDVAPAAFADQGKCSSSSGGQCASNNAGNGIGANPVPRGSNPEPQ